MKKRVEKSINRENFIEITKIFSDIEIIPMFGTLLGLFRDGDIIEGDDDIDFGVNIALRDVIVERLMGTEFLVDLTSDTNSTPYFLQAERCCGSHKSLIDFYFWEFSADDHEIINRWTCSAASNREDDLHFKKDAVYPLKSVAYFGQTVKFPANPEECCRLFYGEDWSIPAIKYLDYTYVMDGNSIKIIKFDENQRIERRNKEIERITEEREIEKYQNQKKIDELESKIVIQDIKIEELLKISDVKNVKTIKYIENIESYSRSVDNKFHLFSKVIFEALLNGKMTINGVESGALISQEAMFSIIKHVFNADWYLDRNPDVAAAGVDPLQHFITYGYKEGRLPHPFWVVSDQS